MKVNLKGTITTNDDADIFRYFGFIDVCCPGDISSAIENSADGEELEIIINSGGGDLISGNEMYSMLRAYPGNTVARIQSLSGSAATVAMMGCKKRIADPPSLICVHNPTAYGEGDASEHKRTAKELENVKKAILNAYESRVKVSREEISALMDKDILIDSTEALKYGLIDEISGEGEPENQTLRIINAASGTGMVYPTAEMTKIYHDAKDASDLAARLKRETETAALRQTIRLNKLK